MGWLLQREVLAYSMKDEIKGGGLDGILDGIEAIAGTENGCGREEEEKKRNSGGAEEGHLKADVSQVIVALFVTAGDC